MSDGLQDGEIRRFDDVEGDKDDGKAGDISSGTGLKPSRVEDTDFETDDDEAETIGFTLDIPDDEIRRAREAQATLRTVSVISRARGWTASGPPSVSTATTCTAGHGLLCRRPPPRCTHVSSQLPIVQAEGGEPAYADYASTVATLLAVVSAGCRRQHRRRQVKL
ncbi:hypothetical protein HK405_015337 [Cladochytrium tenue]|nr:hypothetical protein HK405_015337 [Cladochytrium tenue]